MADEKLRLQAEVRDNMSPALRKIKELLGSIRQSPQMAAATDQMKRLGDETKKFVGGGDALSSTLDSLGVGGLATAGGLAAVVTQMRELGQRSLDMKEFARETGVSVDWLNAWSRAGSNFDVNADSMNTALNSLSAQMPGLESKTSELYALLAQRWPTLADKLLGDNPEQRMKDVLDFLGNDPILKKNPQLQKKAAGEFFSNPDDVEKLFRDGAKGFWDEFNKQAKALDPINKDLLAQAQEFRESLTGLNTALANFENKIDPGFLKNMALLVKQAEDVVEILEDPTSAKGWKDLAKDTITVKPGSIADQLLHGDGSKPAAPEKAAATGALQGRADIDKQLRDSLSRSNPLFHRSAFTTGDSPRQSTYVGLAGLISDGTKSGVLAAFRELMAGNEAGQPSAGGGDFTNASYETSGDDPVAAGRAIGRLDGSASGGAFHDPNAFYDAIISAEGTGKRGNPYDTSLGYTKSPKPLTDMTMAQALQWGDWIRKHTRIGELTNSSAKGAFQIVNTTQLAAMRALGLHMDDLFSETNQQRMASWIAHHQGLGAWTSFSTHRELLARAAKAMREGADSATSSGRPAAPQGSIRADVHIHGDVKKAVVKTRGAIEAKLTRWPSMSDYA